MTLIRTTILLLTVALVASCGTLKPAAKLQNTNYLQAVESNENKETPKFLDVKPIRASKVVALEIATNSDFLSPTVSTSKASEGKTTLENKGSSNTNTIKANVDAESFNMLQLKYAIILDVPAETVTNILLLQTIEDWYGTRYVFGGTSKRGVDCSSLMQHIFKTAYDKKIPRTAITQYRATQRINQDELKEGDLVFFHTTRSGISHVGFYLGNRKFVHASCSRGVTVSSLDEKYYQNAYRGGGRFAFDYTFSD
jgi:lipoprotein Spr